MVLSADHAWVKQAAGRPGKQILDKLAADRTAQHAAEYRQTLARLKKDYITAYVGPAQQGAPWRGRRQDEIRAAQGSPLAGACVRWRASR